MRRDRLAGLGLLAAAWLSTAVWLAALCLVAAPWRHLGGIVDERLRWLLRFCLAGGLWAGFVAADAFWTFALGPTEALLWNPRALRWLLYPAAIVAACAMVCLRLAGADDAIGIALTALVAYGTGVWTRVTGIVGRAAREDAEREEENDD